MSKDSQRQERLRIWLQSNSPECNDFKEEILLCLKNSEMRLKAANCTNREFAAGECAGLQMILDFCEIYENLKMPEDKDVD